MIISTCAFFAVENGSVQPKKPMDRQSATPSDNTGVVVIVLTVPKDEADAMPAGNYIALFPRFFHKMVGRRPFP